MIWIAWRFQRSVVGALVLLALAIVGAAFVTGILQHHYLAEMTRASCLSGATARHGYCNRVLISLDNVHTYDTYVRVAGYVIAPIVGGILGLFALASELDQRTARLSWTQSISRRRWFAGKVGVGAALVTVILVPVAIVLSWWNGAIANSDIYGRETFGIAGWDLVAYGLFMFALTLLLGALIRRVGWTLATAIALFLVVAVVMPFKVRPHLAPQTVHWTSSFSSGVISEAGGATFYDSVGYPANAWVFLSGDDQRSVGGTPTLSDVSKTGARSASCMTHYPSKTVVEQEKAMHECYKALDIERVSIFISGDQFWTIQLREGLLYLAASLILTGGAWVVTRRIEP